MQIPVEIKRVDPKSDFHAMALFWRGQCIDCYSRGEVVVSECLEALRDADLELSHESSHVGHQARARSLEQILGELRFRGHAKKALRYLREWQDFYRDRVWLAHGEMKFTATKAEFRYRDYSGGMLTISAPLVHDRHSMKDYLERLETALWHLRSQLGQIRAASVSG